MLLAAQDVLAQVAQVAVLGAALAGGIVLIWSTVSKTTRDLWKQEAEALKSRVTTLEAQDADCRAKQAELETTVHVLQDQVTGATAIGLLTRATAVQHDEVVGYLRDIKGMLDGRRQGDQ